MTEAKREAVFSTALSLSAQIGAINITKKALCEAAGIPLGSFQNVMGQTFAEMCEALPADAPGTEVTKKRTSATRRRQHILDVAVDMAAAEGFQNVKRDQLAMAARVSTGLVTKYFGNMCKLKRAIMRHAVSSDNATVVAQGLAIGDPHARKASKELKAHAAKIITG